MASRKVKKYRMTEISKQVSEKGGFTAAFLSDGYTVDGLADILPGVLRDGGMKVSEGVARDIIHGYNVACLNHTATTGEPVDMGDTMSLLSIRGLYENSDSRASRDNVRVSMRIKEELRPKVTFSMSNVLDGRTLMVYSATTEGCELRHVRQGSVAAINGQWLTMLDGDSVTATMKDASRHDVVADCEILSSRDDRVEVRVPSAFDGESFVGGEITFTVTNSCGQPGFSQQTKRTTATLLAGSGGDDPTPPDPDPIWESTDGAVKVMSVSDSETGDTFTWGNVWDILGEGFTGTAPGWFVEIAMLSTAPGASTVNLDFDVKSATEVELTPGAGAELEAGDYPNAMITFGIAHNGDEGLVTESAEIPVHLVVSA